ncbi:hypothetical protein RvY_10571 [Ramazzottius varieornatus]|uniref:Uncharacterized protein n=1 Tax=Ramazzottius varieornatus TaxID=947166 RepID=A0A1D1VIK5_RAMVA|nr:hypothetical protein RvY_10571 [Ramazzottius varieornatus]
MPRAKKYVTKLQPVTGDDLEDQLSRTVIIHPGSRYLRILRPSDTEAVVQSHCIARKQRLTNGQASVSRASSSSEVFRSLDSVASTTDFKQAAASAETWLKGNSKEEKTLGRTYCSFDAKESEETTPVTKEYVVGNEALDVGALHSNFVLSWPIRYGHFNLHDGPGGSRSAVATDIENIWDWVLTNELGITRKLRGSHRAVLVIPDIYNREDVRSLVEILLTNLDFFAVFVVLENVASMFGACIPSACVVDVGAEKTVVSCVDDGISLAETRLLMHCGGDDITRLTNWYLQQKVRSFNLKIASMTDWFKMDAIKKALVHFDFTQSGSNDIDVGLPSPDREESLVMKLPHDFCRFPGLALFQEGLVSFPPNTQQTFTFQYYPGSYDDVSGTEGRAKRPATKKPTTAKPENTEADTTINPENIFDTIPENNIPEEKADLDTMKIMKLHEAIYWSISRCATEEQQKRMLKNILVVGGGLVLFPGALDFLTKRLEEVVPAGTDLNVITNSREIPGDLHAVKGASVMAALETVQYLWITKEEWIRTGIKIIREKSSFGW